MYFFLSNICITIIFQNIHDIIMALDNKLMVMKPIHLKKKQKQNKKKQTNKKTNKKKARERIIGYHK